MNDTELLQSVPKQSRYSPYVTANSSEVHPPESRTKHLYLENLISRKTGGRIKNLRVETVNGRTVVSGRATTYHAWQLALAVVRETFDFSQRGTPPVDLDIQVVDIS